ncbi:class I SAM-dependent methyltransferase [Hoeflea sp.]|uniref:class I SAM-dependent methyltransferase n=1 Tax=Hoeflea sp. TaxID=1940281 RepID=UPI003B02E266
MTMTLAATEIDDVAVEATCWVCGSENMALANRGNLPQTLGSEAFQITDQGYGRTADIHRCADCGFLQCSDLPDVLEYYEDMDDTGYEDTRAQRALQARRLLQTIAPFKPGGRLLDVGAGSGILVDEALQAGYHAEGIEPSVALQKRAAASALSVHLGVLPDPSVRGPYDCVTLIDVIEHVPDPVGLLTDIAGVLKDDGVCLIVTPDVRSWAARLMRWHWWHYRIAHIGYFDRSTLTRAAGAAGLQILSISRPTWYFPASYLMERVLSYAPNRLRPPVPRMADKITVPLNLFDSYALICRKAKA